MLRKGERVRMRQLQSRAEAGDSGCLCRRACAVCLTACHLLFR